ncbi:ribbon-helix-helix protein, CopG family [uncultured Sulfitobacter sp.]|uniref:ribbon-helix-helix protein, CopG family n=1 Tax=uncultured Sulfitobacter sp. TaxID=191468 RepID=UPI0030D8014D
MKSRGRPNADTQPVMVRMPTELIEAIDAARRAEEDLPSRPELIRRIVGQWAEGRRQDQ